MLFFQLQCSQFIDNETWPEGDEEVVFVKTVYTEGYRLSDWVHVGLEFKYNSVILPHKLDYFSWFYIWVSFVFGGF